MGLLEDLTGQLAGSLGGDTGNHAGLVQSVAGLVQQQGGLQGLLGQLQQGGLGDIASSWVSTGPNLPVQPHQLQSALGSGAIGTLAQQIGVSPDAAATQLSAILPLLVDRLTPNGSVPQGGAGLLEGLLGGQSGGLLEQGLGALKDKLF